MMEEFKMVVFICSIVLAFIQVGCYEIKVPSGVRIANGHDAYPGQFPYQALITSQLDENHYLYCGGSLISFKFVITAAHCIQRQRIDIYLGFVNSVTKKGAEHTCAINTYIHPDYNAVTHKNDIALLELDSNYNIKDYIKPVALPSCQQTSPEYYDNRCGVVSGWGMTGNGDTGPQENLQFSLVHIATHSCCQQLFPNYYFTDCQICSDKTIPGGFCKGDSGGPLVFYPSPGEPVLIGIASWSVGSCVNPYPNVYTFVGAYLKFIHGITGINNQSSA